MNPFLQRNKSLKPFNTFHVGGRAKQFVTAYTTDDIEHALSIGGQSTLILGKGSNVLVSDFGYEGLAVLNLCDNLVSLKNDGTLVTVESGLSLPRLSRMFLRYGLTGLEWAVSIPGTVGGAMLTNAGAFGGCMADVICSAEVLRGGKRMTLSNSELGFGYRHSALKSGDVVLQVCLSGKKDERDAIERRMQLNIAARLSTQPTGFSAGSIFLAADGEPAGRLIDNCGLKGYAVGGAKISEKHANFIINNGYALAADIKQLIDTVKAVVYAQRGIALKEEIKYVGDF